MEPELVDPDDPFGDAWKPGQYAKWQVPTNETEELILASVDRKYFLTTNERDAIHKISVNTHSLRDRECEFPEEWVKSCLSWVKKKREKGEMVQLRGLISLLYNKERRDVFVDRWTTDHKDEFRRFGG